MHCHEPACVEVCPEEAISKRPEDGIVVVDREACIACGTCFEACPFEVPQFGEDEVMQKCDICVDERDSNTDAPPCVATCPTEALAVVKMTIEEKQKAEKTMMDLVKSAKSRSWEEQKAD
jgi:anaerobic dimethyl sulfoxide reductase subunit B (iron-sulfur subunit)